MSLYNHAKDIHKRKRVIDEQQQQQHFISQLWHNDWSDFIKTNSILNWYLGCLQREKGLFTCHHAR